jgi:hypothetical protein
MQFRRNNIRFAAMTIALGAFAPIAGAQFLVDPTGGTVLSAQGDDDTNYGGRALGFTGHFFGDAHTTVDVCSNGFLDFSGDTNFSQVPMPTGTAHINALWDDLFVYGGQSITEKVSPGNYYSVTYQIGTFEFGHVFHQFQAVWFGAATTIRGFQFLPDDIVLDYESVGASPWEATVGLDRGNGADFVALPGDADGSFNDSQRSLLPIYPTSHTVILFRPVGSSYISMQILTNSPCPADFNSDGIVNSQDFFDFLNAFFAGC